VHDISFLRPSHFRACLTVATDVEETVSHGQASRRLCSLQSSRWTTMFSSRAVIRKRAMCAMNHPCTFASSSTVASLIAQRFWAHCPTQPEWCTFHVGFRAVTSCCGNNAGPRPRPIGLQRESSPEFFRNAFPPQRGTALSATGCYSALTVSILVGQSAALPMRGLGRARAASRTSTTRVAARWPLQSSTDAEVLHTEYWHVC
jgi:hypothetical protein